MVESCDTLETADIINYENPPQKSFLQKIPNPIKLLREISYDLKRRCDDIGKGRMLFGGTFIVVGLGMMGYGGFDLLDCISRLSADNLFPGIGLLTVGSVTSLMGGSIAFPDIIQT